MRGKVLMQYVMARNRLNSAKTSSQLQLEEHFWKKNSLYILDLRTLFWITSIYLNYFLFADQYKMHQKDFIIYYFI